MGIYIPGIEFPQNRPKTVTIYPDGTVENIDRSKRNKKAISITNTDRTTKWEGKDENGPRAVLIKHDGPFADILQEALRKLAKYEDMEEA